MKKGLDIELRMRNNNFKKKDRDMSVRFYGTEKVGETFEYEGKKYRVLKEDCSRCECCDFKEKACHEMGCMPFERDDKKSVFYKEVE